MTDVWSVIAQEQEFSHAKRNMPLTRDGVAADRALNHQTLQTALGEKLEHTDIIIDEVDEANWGFSGMATSENRRRELESG